MKSLKRLQIDPLAVYGTLCVKCPVADPVMADPACIARLAEELAIVAAQDRRRDGRRTRSASLNELDVPLRRELAPVAGRAPAVHARRSRRCTCPNIDEALDEESAKREFWSAFRVLGQWWADLPPY